MRGTKMKEKRRRSQRTYFSLTLSYEVFLLWQRQPLLYEYSYISRTLLSIVPTSSKTALLVLLFLSSD
jgi:hypothetical protein